MFEHGPSLKNVQTRPLFRHGPAPLSVPAPHCSAQDVPLKLYRPLNCIESCYKNNAFHLLKVCNVFVFVFV